MVDKMGPTARARRGVVLAEDLGSHPSRAASRHGLESVHPGAYVASTQPVTFEVLLEAVRCASPDRNWVVMEQGALWLYGEGEPPEQLILGVPLGHKLAVRPPVKVRRVTPSVWQGNRPLKGGHAVALEVAVIQVAKQKAALEVRELVERLVRGRRTTIVRLRGRCRRGLAGSSRVRAVCDELAGGSMEKDVRRLKAALEVLGVTGLEAEVHFTNAEGASAYADLLHRPTMTVIEVDGFVEHLRRERFRADRRRDRWMRRQHAATTLRIDVLEIREDLEALATEIAWFLLPSAEQSATA